MTTQTLKKGKMLTEIFTNFIKTGNKKNLPLRLQCSGTFVPPPLKVLTFFPVNRGVEGLLFSLNSNIFDSKTFNSNFAMNVFNSKLNHFNFAMNVFKLKLNHFDFKLNVFNSKLNHYKLFLKGV